MNISRILRCMETVDLYGLLIAIAEEAAHRDYVNNENWIYDSFDSCYTDVMFGLKNRNEVNKRGLRPDADGTECC